MLQANLLEGIPETRYLSADNYRVYRTIMRIFYLEHQKMHYQMDRDAVLILLRGQAVFADYTPEQLTLDLQQLVKWKNLTPIQDPRKPRTIAEFTTKQYQYLMKYEGPSETPYAEYKSYIRYVLTNDSTVSWEELQWSTYSSLYEDKIDYNTVYTDLIYDT